MPSGRTAQFNPVFPDSTLRQLVSAQPVVIEITTPSVPGALLTIKHNLGRIPKGYFIAKGPYMTFQHGWNPGDTAWTNQYMYLRFSILSTSVTLAVF